MERENVKKVIAKARKSVSVQKNINFRKHVWREFLVGKPEGKRPLGRSTRRWEDNLKIDLEEVR